MQQQDDVRSDVAQKAPYTAPQFVEYGDVKTLTESSGSGSFDDGSGGGAVYSS